jgi:hypothetical protein
MKRLLTVRLLRSTEVQFKRAYLLYEEGDLFVWYRLECGTEVHLQYLDATTYEEAICALHVHADNDSWVIER